MPYGQFHHNNRSRDTVIEQDLDYFIPQAQAAELAVEDVDGAAAQEGYELQDLRERNGPNDQFQGRNDVRRSDCALHDEPDFTNSRRDSGSTTQSFMLYTPDEERAVRRKFDYKLVLFVAFLYMLSFLDRSSKSPFLLDLDYFCVFLSAGKIIILHLQTSLGRFALFLLEGDDM